ncbi:MAG: phytanoyl-CoA dioxygenase family protein [Alphaproteobacteria bacterium]|nr:phytanoyl-CoA dioxygenase family protein [Alphaproteobacteria bacterium]
MARGRSAVPQEPGLPILIKSFRRDGYVAVRGLLDPSEVNTFRRSIDAAVARRTSRDTRSFDERSPYGQMFRQCLFLWEDTPAVRPLNFHPAVAGMAAALLGAERVRLWHDQALYKEPGGGETEAHQDYAYWPVAEPDLVTAWIPLVEVDESNGCMGYVAGTQDSAREYVDIFASPGAGRAYAARFAGPEFIPARPGDVIFHAARTVHMAKPNRSERTRAVHTVVYFRDGCTWAPAANGDDDGRRMRAGEPIDGPDTPIAWPRLTASYPEPPERDAARGVAAHFARIGLFPGTTEGTTP